MEETQETQFKDTLIEKENEMDRKNEITRQVFTL